MKTHNTNTLSTHRSPLRAALLLIGLSLFVQGCGSGSGASVEENPVTVAPTVSNYTGPAPASADVQAFKLAVWDNLVPNNRCGSCHNESQTPRFVRADDINLAYDTTNALVDLNDPGLSLLVNKVRGGHNCWESDADACGDIIESYIENWASDTIGGGSKTVQLVPPPIQDPGESKNFPVDTGLFASTVYPLLNTYCAQCHSDTAAIAQAPFIASDDIDVAYAAAQARMNLELPENSRFVLRLGSEFHNCWTQSCSDDADEMLAAIQAFSDAITPDQIDPALVTSKAMKLTDGIISSAGGRFENNLIALYEFKTGSGNTVFDTSGVEPSLNLTLSGDYSWVGGWGVAFTDGKAQGSTTASRKLHDLIKATNEYTVELWVVPGNVSQDGPARIVSYAGSAENRNFMVGQTLYNYDTFNRSTETDQSGDPQLSTADDDEDLQASLQHMVLTYDPANGRRIYVNGEFTEDLDSATGGLLNDWDETYALAIASEVDNQNRWAGTVRMLAVHNRALTEEQIVQNFEVGVGEKYFVLFNVSDHVGLTDAYIVFEASQFDSYSYLFDTPFFIVLDSATDPGTIPVAGMRIGLNGRELEVGQAFANLDTSITSAAYATEGRQTLSPQGTVIQLDKGPELDEFFLTFEQLGTATNVYVEATPPAPATPGDQPRGPELGVRDFAEINATMAQLTGIPITNPGVSGTYELVQQAMPVNPILGGFLSSQQMGVTQLAISYCSALVDDGGARGTYFPGLDFNAAPATAFSDRSVLMNPLFNSMIGAGVVTQPAQAELETELNALVDRLSSCGAGCEADRTERIVKGACAAVLGSAAMLVQ
ncbi:MAG: LamG domain-containing protein [Pseudomonadota bacterium]